MRVLLIGCGAVGLSLASALYGAGWEVDLVARGETAGAIEAGGIFRRGVLGNAAVPPGRLSLAASPEEAPGGYDYILVSAKVTGNPDIAAALAGRKRELFRGARRLVLFQNGYGNERAFLPAFGREEIFHAYFSIGFRRPEPNVSEVTVVKAPIDLGSIFGAPAAGCEALAEAVDRGGVPCRLSEELGKVLWSKLLYNCTLNALGAVLNTTYGGLAESGHSLALMTVLIGEIYDVMRAAGGETFWPDAGAYRRALLEEILPQTAGHRSSTLQDLERRLPTEIDSLNGAVAVLGEELGVPTPCNRFLTHMVKAAEDLYTQAGPGAAPAGQQE